MLVERVSNDLRERYRRLVGGGAAEALEARLEPHRIRAIIDLQICEG
jgi:hypothetical protein